MPMPTPTSCAIAVSWSSRGPAIPDRAVRGWWLRGVDENGRADDRGGAWPQLVIEDLDAEREHLEHAAPRGDCEMDRLGRGQGCRAV
jgi:hypothetical protein